MVRRYPVNPDQPERKPITEAATIIRRGGLVIVPTDTAYGLAGNPRNSEVIQRILAVKGRHQKPGMPVLAATLDQVRAITQPSAIAEILATQFWPGGLTLVVRSRHSFPPGLLGPNSTLAIRIPNHPVTLAIIRETGFPITGTSANRSNAPSPRTAQEADAQIGTYVDLILDAGPTSHTTDSTIVDCTQHPPQILRRGAVPEHLLRPWL